MIHKPVLQKEVIKYLDLKPNENFIDCTVGQGGHLLEVLKHNGPEGKVLGIDRDSLQIENCKLRIRNFRERVILVNDSYINLKKIVEKLKFKPVKGILFDLGMSSWHLEKSGRGFTFLKDEPLDMRYSCNRYSDDDITFFGRSSKKRYQLTTLTAEEIINNWLEKEIEKILREYGEEKLARKIAEKIVEERKKKPIETTFQLVETVKGAVPLKYRRGKIHFATRTFQALRIAVNDELNNLKRVLPQAIEVLTRPAPTGRRGEGGRLVIISFHSLEDRIIKNFLKNNKNLEILTKKPIKPSQEEIKINPRSRSAKLRAAIKI